MPRKVKEKAENYSEIEDYGSLLNMLITFAVLIALTALICTIVWKTTHKEPRTELGNVDVPVSPSLSETLVAEEELGEHGNSVEDYDIEVEPINGGADMAFDPVDEDVTAKDAAIIRIVPDTDGITTVAGQLKNGQFLKRIGINKDTGWSKVLFDGKEGYALSFYLTTDKSYKTKAPANPDNRVTTMDGYVVLFKDCDDVVTMTTQENVTTVNLRTEPSTTQGKATISAQLTAGLTARRTGISIDAGWSRIEFNGLVLYVVTKFIEEVNE
ncbi:MAG: hypothetical protein IKS85_10285 [Lachnospiraceae bacterium]|nr:hypothetical protein [Lachnospiraceae bacterium]